MNFFRSIAPVPLHTQIECPYCKYNTMVPAVTIRNGCHLLTCTHRKCGQQFYYDVSYVNGERIITSLRRDEAECR